MNPIEPLERLGRIIGGKERLERIRRLHVMVAGLGGVGGAAVEALARCGVGKLTLIDGDVIAASNLNRQLIATQETLTMRKTEAARLRVTAINPDAQAVLITRRLSPDEVEGLIGEAMPDAVIDAIDDIPVKAALALACQNAACYEAASLGMGNRLDPTKVRLGDIFEVTHDPLARVLRRLLRRDGVGCLRVAFSLETPVKPLPPGEGDSKNPPGSSAFVPNAAGLALAYDVVSAALNGGIAIRV